VRMLLPQYRDSETKVFISVPLWGEEYIQKWVSWSAPTLLASGNLPSIAAEYSVEVQIATTADWVTSIKRQEAFSELSKHCQCVIRVIEQPSTPYAGMSRANYLTMTDALRNKGIYTYSNADMVWANKSFSFLVRALIDSKVVLSWSGISDEVRFCKSLDSFRSGTSIEISSHEMAQLMLMHPHEIQRRWTLSTGFVPRALSSLIWVSPDLSAAVVKSFTLGVVGINFRGVDRRDAKQYLRALQRGVPSDHSVAMSRLVGDSPNIYVVDNSSDFLITSFDSIRPLNADRQACTPEEAEQTLQQSLARQSRVESPLGREFFKCAYTLSTANSSYEWVDETLLLAKSYEPYASEGSRFIAYVVRLWWLIPLSARSFLEKSLRMTGIYPLVFRFIRGFDSDKST